MSISMIGLTVVTVGVANWWREDLPFNGYGEQLATSDPFAGQHIRKAGIWVFLMSEVMVFATFFSSYLRMRTEWCTKWALDDGKCSPKPERVWYSPLRTTSDQVVQNSTNLENLL